MRDPGTLCGEGRQVGSHHDGRDGVGVQVDVAGVDAETFEHGLQALLRERRIVERVAGAIQADHEAVADELVFANAFEIGNILDTGGGVYRCQQSCCSNGGGSTQKCQPLEP